MNDQSDIPADLPAIGISFKQTLDDYREVVMQTHIPVNCSDEHLNELLDKLSKATDRQKSKIHLPTLKGFLADKRQGKIAETEKLFLARSELETHDSIVEREAKDSNRRNWKPSPPQAQARAAIQARIGQSEQNLRVLDKEIAIAERQIKDAELQISAGG